MLQHEIGHLPFQSDITKYLHYGVENRVTVACDNTLLNDTVPQGIVTEIPVSVYFKNLHFYVHFVIIHFIFAVMMEQS